jgi:ribosome-associated protein
MTTETAAKKDIQKLQRAIIDGLEDVKAQDIQVFNTEHLSPLFERVIVASGTSNRQTKALAASVRDAVRDAGFGKPRVEGEENGEWIIVDCGAAVAHIMQPAFRQYYHLEELWGEKPVRLKFGAPKPVEAKPEKAPAKKTGAKSGAAKKPSLSIRRVSSAKKEAARPPLAEAPPQRGVPAKAPAKKAAAKSGARPATQPATKAATKAPVKSAPKSVPKTAAKSPAKPAPKKPAPRNA